VEGSCTDDLESLRAWGEPEKLSKADEFRECLGVCGDDGIFDASNCRCRSPPTTWLDSQAYDYHRSTAKCSGLDTALFHESRRESGSFGNFCRPSLAVKYCIADLVVAWSPFKMGDVEGESATLEMISA
jgi:hypothetical protein